MKILVIGASRGTGALAVQEACRRGHTVAAFSRDPDKLTYRHEHVVRVRGDFHDAESVSAAVGGQDAVIVTASSSSLKGFKQNPSYFSQGTAYVIEAMSRHGVKRLVVLSALGVGDSRKQMGFLADKLLISFVLKIPYLDHERQERQVMASALDWVIARPSRLTNAPARHRYIKTSALTAVPSSISRADVADFLVEAATTDTWVRKAVAARRVTTTRDESSSPMNPFLLRVKRRAVRLLVRGSEAALARLHVPRASALLILGHMRSGSTLLLHLLLTNPEVGGMGERNAVYATADDVARLALACRLARRAPLARLRYVVDQVNHDRFTPSERLLEHPRVRSVFLLRRPVPSLSSLVELTRTHYREAWPIERAVDYYVERLATLSAYGTRLASCPRKAAVFLTYEDLTRDPGPTLAGLQRFLELPSGFSERYGCHDFTGRRGDPGPVIGTGRIAPPRSGGMVDLPAHASARVNEAYARCVDVLSRFALRPTAPNP